MLNSNVEKLYANEFYILKKYGELVDGWSNVYEHCKTECKAALVIAHLAKLPDIERDILAKAAILHDWYKRKEKESSIKGSEKYNQGVADSYNELLKLGVDKRIVDIAHSVGHSSLKNILNETDSLKKIVHFIDDITFDSEVVELDVRINALESAERYKELNEQGRKEHNGRTYFEVQREIGHKIQAEIEKTINESNPEVKIKAGELVKLIKLNMKD